MAAFSPYREGGFGKCCGDNNKNGGPDKEQSLSETPESIGPRFVSLRSLMERKVSFAL
jgi:hypothetical protein